MIIASRMAGYEGHCGWIHYLAVSPSLQGRGYAKQIMEERIAYTREKHAK